MAIARFLAAVLVSVSVTIAPVRAERPIVDLHRLDAYFALFAGDSSVPWKRTAVRLDTYSSAPVSFSVYQVDPDDVLTAGSNARPRAVATAHRRPIASFHFTPPGGYQFQSNEVDVPLGSREGFFVVEARRGNVGEQVWINRSRVGLLAKATPGSLLLWGVDLGTGMPLARMRVQFVVGGRFATAMTDGEGLLRWNRSPRPVFALAQWGSSYAFLSPLPQAPFPSAIVGVRTESAVVHAGGTVRVIGFARSRVRGVLRAGTGTALVSLRSGARRIGESSVPLDGAGAFSASFVLPENAPAGDYAVLAQAAGGVGGATVHVDANAGDLSLEAAAECSGPCAPTADVPLRVHSSRGGVVVAVTVVRSPHVYVGAEPEGTPWGTTRWLETSVRTDAAGNAVVAIPHPTDDLPSTYGVHVEGSGATADTRIVVPTARAAIRLTLDRTEQSLGAPLGFSVDAAHLDGNPLGGATVSVRLVHGPSVQEQQIALDRDGHARGSFSSPALGTDTVFASVDDGGRAVDAAQVQIDPQASSAGPDGASPNVRVTLDRSAYRAGEEIVVRAGVPGSQGAALITSESALGIDARIARTSGGEAIARLRATDAAGELRVGAAFVRDGTIAWSSVPLSLLAPGRPHVSPLALSGEAFSPGEPVHVGLGDAPGGAGTFVVRISKGAPSGSALFGSAPALLAIGVTTTQNSSPESVTWHPWVDSTGNHAQILGFVRRTQPPPEVSLAQADTEAVSWNVSHGSANGVGVAMPQTIGRYTISVLEIADDGSVSAGSSAISVR
jgi:hypothetical protein